jgi:DNA-binding transcriptional ArsR family regulator
VDALQVIGEPRRREILRLVWDRERTAGDIASQFDVTFGAVSQHLGVLRDAGLVNAHRIGRVVLYVRSPTGETLVSRNARGDHPAGAATLWHVFDPRSVNVPPAARSNFQS